MSHMAFRQLIDNWSGVDLNPVGTMKGLPNKIPVHFRAILRRKFTYVLVLERIRANRVKVGTSDAA